MKIIPDSNILSKKQWFSIFGANIAAGILWASHFVLEYSACVRNEIPIYFVIFAYIGCFVGGIFALKIASKIDHYFRYLLFIGLDILSLSLLLVISQKWSIALLLFGTGFFGSCFTGSMFTQLTVAFPDPKYNGRVNAMGYFSMTLIIILFTVFNKEQFIWINILILWIFYLIIFFLTLNGKSDNKIIEQKPINQIFYFQSRGTSFKLVIGFFWGFFLTIPFYIPFLIMENENLIQHFNTFILILCISIILFSIPNGMLLDTLGRRIVMLIGLTIQAFSFLLLYLISDSAFIYTFFPFLLGIGTTMFQTSNSLIIVELSIKKYLRDSITISYILMGLGMISAVFFGELLKMNNLLELSSFTVILLFVFLLATVLISQITETLPSKSELEWKEAIQSIFVLYKSGLTIFIEDYCKESGKYLDNKEDLLSGALIAVSSILKEIGKNREPLKVIKQNNFTILIEEGKHVIVGIITTRDLKKIRIKMLEFLGEFELKFSKLLEKEIVDIMKFRPTKHLIEKYFFYYW